MVNPQDTAPDVDVQSPEEQPRATKGSTASTGGTSKPSAKAESETAPSVQSVPNSDGTAASPAPVPAPPRRSQYVRPEGPRKVRHGIKLSSRDGVNPKNWVTARWLQAVEATWDASVLGEAQEYGRIGQTRSLEFERGQVSGQVQGSAPLPYDTKLDFAPYDDNTWEQIVSSMASFGMLAAQLFSEEMPAADVIEPALEPVNVTLVPSAPLPISCTCPLGQRHQPCKHSATLALLLAERLNSDAMLIFSMRGMAAPVLIDRVRRARTIRTQGVATAHAEPFIPETQVPAIPLDQCIDEYWRAGSRVHDLERQESSTYAPHALLRRLGPSPLRGRFPLVGLLASIYDQVAAEARRMQDTTSDDPDDSE
jgi:uncharacterized Zn finger protein